MRAIEILLVEDSAGDELLTRKVFERSRILNRLHVVHDGQEALDFLHKRGDYAHQKTPDLVLLDLHLPKIDGPQVLKAIKEHPELRDLAVVMLTGSTAEVDVMRSYDLQAGSFISKPLTLQGLSRAMLEMDRFSLAIVDLPPK